MDMLRLRQELIRHEGYMNEIYIDSLGYETGGIGHLLLEHEAAKYDAGDRISDELVEQWFTEDVNTAIKRARRILGEPHFERLDPVRQRVLVNMAFNLGNKLEGFKNTLAFVRAGNYVQAAQNMRKSLWYRQVKRRGEELAIAMESGYFPF